MSIQKTSTGNLREVKSLFHPVTVFAFTSSHLLKWKPRLLMGGKGAKPDISDSLVRMAFGGVRSLSYSVEEPNTKKSIAPDSDMKLTYVTFL